MVQYVGADSQWGPFRADLDSEPLSCVTVTFLGEMGQSNPPPPILSTLTVFVRQPDLLINKCQNRTGHSVFCVAHLKPNLLFIHVRLCFIQLF